jgi:hypothetical protein
MKNWDDERLLDYLMTSDFDDNLSPEDLRFLLLKFRNFFRIVSSRITTNELERKRFEFDIEHLKQQKNEEIEHQKNSYDNLLNIYNSIITRKLTLSERFQGKIKLKPNESI